MQLQMQFSVTEVTASAQVSQVMSKKKVGNSITDYKQESMQAILLSSFAQTLSNITVHIQFSFLYAM